MSIKVAGQPSDQAPPASSTKEPGARTLGPLTGYLVVDLSRALAGPHATMMMGDLGARVIKVEPPGEGDDSRTWGPPFVGQNDGEGGHVESTYFLSANRNKESIVLDLKTEGDRNTLLDLVTRADVLVENYRPGVLDRLGLGHKQLHDVNPRLVVLSITGFGHDGPEANRAGYDQIVQGESGLMSLTGSDANDPQKVGVPISDLLAGMYGAYGVLAALLERERTGQGQVVRTSLLAASIGVHAFQSTRWTVAHELGHAAGNHHAAIAPYGLFRCADGAVQIAIGSQKLWGAFCAAFDLDPTLPDLLDNAARVDHRTKLIAMIEAVFAAWPAHALLERLIQLGIPAGKVRNLDEVYAWDQTRSQGLIVEVDHESLGTLRLAGPPLRFFAQDGDEITRTRHTAPPVLNANAAAIHDWLTREPT